MSEEEKSKVDDERMTENDAEDQAERGGDPPSDAGQEEVIDVVVEGEEVDQEDKDVQTLSVEDEHAELQSELDDVRLKAEEYLDGWQRARAEFANYKKRVQKEREETRSFIAAEILAKYLSVVDDLERALNDQPAEGGWKAWVEGIEMIYRKLKNILEAEGVEEISAKGEMFDPTYHEAISFEESEDHDEGEIVDVIQPGYKIGERVIRPAVVRVAK